MPIDSPKNSRLLGQILKNRRDSIRDAKNIRQICPYANAMSNVQWQTLALAKSIALNLSRDIGFSVS